MGLSRRAKEVYSRDLGRKERTGLVSQGYAGGERVAHQPVELCCGKKSDGERIVTTCGEKRTDDYRRVAWWLPRKEKLVAGPKLKTRSSAEPVVQ